jgi:tricorn protease-like protein
VIFADAGTGVFDGQEHKVLNIADESEISYINWSYDSKKILAYTNYKDLFIFDVATEIGHKLHTRINIIHKPCWSPNGEFIAHSNFAFNRGQIIISNVNDNNKEIINEEVGYSTVFGWTPDGEYLIYLNASSLSDLQARIIFKRDSLVPNCYVGRMNIVKSYFTITRQPDMASFFIKLVTF